jgi:predicted phosphodiesterase
MKAISNKAPAGSPASPAPNGNIFFCGDLHGNFHGLISAVMLYRPEAIVLLGDIMGDDPEKSLDEELLEIIDLTQIYWIAGNHDTDTINAYKLLFQSRLSGGNLHGRVVEVAGRRIGGLHGVFRGKIWRPEGSPVFGSYCDYIKHAELKRPARLRHGDESNDYYLGEDLKHKSSIFPDDYDALAVMKADVLITHEAGGYHPQGFMALTELAQKMGVTHAFHGHQHDRLDYSKSGINLGFAPHGVGLRGITELSRDGTVTVILNGELDHFYHVRHLQYKQRNEE